jgi:hypothetical protein
MSATLAGVIASLALWGAALAGMSLLPENYGAAAGPSVRVEVPTGLLISRQDMSGQTAYYRELRAAAPASRPEAMEKEGSC